MIQILSEHVPDYESADSILRDIFKGLADLVPNFEQKNANVWLHPLAVRGHNEALRHLYTELTATGTLFPGTDLRLIYDIDGSSLTRLQVAVRRTASFTQERLERLLFLLAQPLNPLQYCKGRISNRSLAEPTAALSAALHWLLVLLTRGLRNTYFFMLCMLRTSRPSRIALCRVFARIPTRRPTSGTSRPLLSSICAC